MRDDSEIDVVIDLDDAKADPAPALRTAEVDADDDTILPAGCEKNEDGSVTVPLLFPRTITIRSNGAVKEERWDRLTFHRLTGKDLNAVRSTSEENQSVVLFTRSTRLPSRIMTVLYEKLDGKDITRCGRVLGTFL